MGLVYINIFLDDFYHMRVGCFIYGFKVNISDIALLTPCSEDFQEVFNRTYE